MRALVVPVSTRSRTLIAGPCHHDGVPMLSSHLSCSPTQISCPGADAFPGTRCRYPSPKAPCRVLPHACSRKDRAEWAASPLAIHPYRGRSCRATCTRGLPPPRIGTLPWDLTSSRCLPSEAAVVWEQSEPPAYARPSASGLHAARISDSWRRTDTESGWEPPGALQSLHSRDGSKPPRLHPSSSRSLPRNADRLRLPKALSCPTGTHRGLPTDAHQCSCPFRSNPGPGSFPTPRRLSIPTRPPRVASLLALDNEPGCRGKSRLDNPARCRRSRTWLLQSLHRAAAPHPDGRSSSLSSQESWCQSWHPRPRQA